MNIIPNLPILHSKKTVGKFVFTQNYLQSQKYTLLLIKQILFIILIYYEIEISELEITGLLNFVYIINIILKQSLILIRFVLINC